MTAKVFEALSAALIAALLLQVTQPAKQDAPVVPNENEFIVFEDDRPFEPALIQEAALFGRVKCGRKGGGLFRPAADVIVRADDDVVAQINQNLTILQSQIDALNLKITNVSGKPGPQGPPGRDGIAGKDGPAGQRGLDGKPGKDGVSPPIDAIVAEVIDEIGVPQPGPRGPAGMAGKDGLPGRDGHSPSVDEIVGIVISKIPKGPAGDRGPAGPQGIAGPAGPAGLPGPQGLTGPRGPVGADAVINPATIAKDLPPYWFVFKVEDPSGHFATGPPVVVKCEPINGLRKPGQLNLVLTPFSSGVPGALAPSVTTPEPTTGDTL